MANTPKRRLTSKTSLGHGASMPSSSVCPEEEPKDIATVEAESDDEMDVDEEASAFLHRD